VAASVVGDLDRGDDRLAANLSTALWWMTGVAATYASYVSADVIAGGRAHLPLLAASSAATAMAGAAAHRTGRDGPLACAVVSAAVAGFSAAALAGLEVPARAGAVALVTSSAAIGLIAAGPRRWRTTWATSVVLLLGSTQAVLATGAATWLVVPTALVVTGVAAGAWLRRSTGEAVAASTVAVAFAGQVLYDVAPQVFSLSTTILVVGIAMVVGCIAVVRRATRSGG
uniref:hypothetical protein n=1 Tax=Euzebya sp. TaxID=1971409 RepID=UPI0035139A77